MLSTHLMMLTEHKKHRELVKELKTSLVQIRQIQTKDKWLRADNVELHRRYRAVVLEVGAARTTLEREQADNKASLAASNHRLGSTHHPIGLLLARGSLSLDRLSVSS